jgi:hypothetical protein
MNVRIPLAAAAAGGAVLSAAFLSAAVAAADSGESSLGENAFTIGDFTFDPGEGPSVEPLFSIPPLLEIGGAGGLYDFVSLINGDTTIGDLLDDSGLADQNVGDLLGDVSLGDLLNEKAEITDLLNPEIADMSLDDLLGDLGDEDLIDLVNKVEFEGEPLGDYDVGDAVGSVLDHLDLKGAPDGKSAGIDLTIGDALDGLGYDDSSINDLLDDISIEIDGEEVSGTDLASEPLLNVIGLDDATLGDLVNGNAELGSLINPDLTIGGLVDDLLGSDLTDQTVGDLLGGLLPDSGTGMEVYGDGGDTLLGEIDTTQNVSNIFGIYSAQFTVTDAAPGGDAAEDDLPAVGAVYAVTDLGLGFENVYEADPTGDGGADITDTLVTPFGDFDLSTPFNAVAELMPADVFADTDTSGGDLFSGLFGGLGGDDSASSLGDIFGGEDGGLSDIFGGGL